MTQDWDLALDRLEQELDTVERALAAGSVTGLPTAWEPPQVGTRIPTRLVPRAVELLTRQDVAVARLSEALTAVRDQISYVGAAQHDTAPPPRPPVFLDQSL